METNFSDHVNSGVFSWLGKNELLHLIACFFKNPNPAKCNYKIYNKELLAIIKYFEQ